MSGSTPSWLPFEPWEQQLPAALRGDPIWRVTAYRRATYLGYVSWWDALTLDRHRMTSAIGSQLYRSANSIGANLAEGYSKSSGRDRARYFEYALGSARECRHWYLAARPTLTDVALSGRLDELGQIVRLLLVSIPRERARSRLSDAAVRRTP